LFRRCSRQKSAPGALFAHAQHPRTRGAHRPGVSLVVLRAAIRIGARRAAHGHGGIGMRAYLASPRVHLSLTLGSLLAALGCEPGGSSLGRYAISVWVTTDPEMPLGSVAIARDGSVLGKTDQHGHAALELVGREGDVATLNV